MATKYNDKFKFNPKDIELIEEGLRGLCDCSYHSIITDQAADSEEHNVNGGLDTKIRKINELLGKIHNQKVFYGQTHSSGAVPLG